VSNRTRRRCLMKKTRVKKSRDTIPLTHQCSSQPRLWEQNSLAGVRHRFFVVL
jgi:hypothetical protein